MSEVAVYDRILCIKGAIQLMDEMPWIKGQMHGYSPSGKKACCAQGYIDLASVAIFGTTFQASELFDQVIQDLTQNLPDIYKRMEFAGLSTWNDTSGRQKNEVRHLFIRTLEVLQVRLGYVR